MQVCKEIEKRGRKSKFVDAVCGTIGTEDSRSLHSTEEIAENWGFFDLHFNMASIQR